MSLEYINLIPDIRILSYHECVNRWRDHRDDSCRDVERRHWNAATGNGDIHGDNLEQERHGVSQMEC